MTVAVPDSSLLGMMRCDSQGRKHLITSSTH